MGVVLVLVLTRTFDFSLVPPEYRGICIMRPFSGLHGSHEADRAWAGRSHLKYGLGYTKGYATLVVGDAPAMLPQYCVSHPPLETCISALGMLLFGRQDWSVRVFDLVLSIACLVVILMVLRRLYGSKCTLLSGLLLVLLPLSASFGSHLLTALLGLWALCRYLQLTGWLTGGLDARPRHLIELGIALFLIVQLNWAGIFYALMIGLHYVFSCVIRKQLQWKILAVLIVASLSSLALNLQFITHGLRHNLMVEAPYSGPEAPASGSADSAWGRMKSLYEWHASDGERSSFPWSVWLGRNLQHAKTNFTAPVLVFCGVYLLYLLAAHAYVLVLRLVGRREERADGGFLKVPGTFAHLWFFLAPGLMFLLVFRGPSFEYPYWQSSLALFLAVSLALGVLHVGGIFTKIHPWFGRAVIAALVLMIVSFCNQGLAECRAMRSQSPQTLALFGMLNKRIPPDKGLLTFKDFMVRRYEGKIDAYQPQYAWYLDREMIPANAWRYEPDYWALSVRIDEVAARTVRQVQGQAQTGLYWCYIIPAREEFRLDPLAEERRGQGMAQVLANTSPIQSITQTPDILPCEPWDTKPAGVTALSEDELERRLNDRDRSDDKGLYWEKHRRYREAVIAELKKLYYYEYYDNRAVPGAEGFCYQGNTPCYLFDLLRPK